MTRNRKIILGILAITLIVFLESFFYYFLFISEKDKTSISVLVYEDDRNWEDLKEGAELAASRDSDVEVNFVVMPSDTNADEQKKYILDEIDSRADYVITSAVDSYELSKKLNGVYASKIEFVLNGTDDNNYTILSPNDYQMGYELGVLIKENEGSDINVGIVSLDDTKKSLNIRCQGIRTALGETDTHYEVWNKSVTGEDLEGFIQDKIESGSVDTIIILNENALNTVIAVIDNLESKLPVYAMVHSEKAVYYLDSKQLKYLIYPDEFGAGYAAVTKLLHPEKIKIKKDEDMISYIAVNRESMYLGEFAKILFPFVK